jgi:hypothetical protein
MNNESGVPFVARHRALLTASQSAGPDEFYDGVLQLWICRRTSSPLVVSEFRSLARSEFGETVITKTSEGTDQSEGRSAD